MSRPGVSKLSLQKKFRFVGSSLCDNYSTLLLCMKAESIKLSVVPEDFIRAGGGWIWCDDLCSRRPALVFCRDILNSSKTLSMHQLYALIFWGTKNTKMNMMNEKTLSHT